MLLVNNKYGYDPIKLIRAVESHTSVWDKSCPEFRIKSQKQTAWEEIFRLVVKNFDELSEEDQKEIGATLLNKWHNLRDAFIRSVKRCIENGERKKYIYTDDLIFLLKNLQINPEEYLSRFEEVSPSPSCSPLTVAHIKRERKESTDNLLVERKKPKRTEETFVEFEPYEEPTIKLEDRMNKEDEAFFSSILPTVSKYSEDDRLEFRMDVLSAMKKIRDKYK